MILVISYLITDDYQNEIDYVKYCWICCLLFLNLIGFIPKIILRQKLNKYMYLRLENETIRDQLQQIFTSKIGMFNYLINNIQFIIYLFGTLYGLTILFLVKQFENLDILCLIIQSFFFCKIILQIQGYKKIYNIQHKGNAPLTQKELNNLKVIKLNTNNLDNFNDTKCSICLDNYHIDQEIRLIKCFGNHDFHKLCIDEWFNQKSRCPCCNTIVNYQ